ncbi:hypothetical protein SAMN02746065_104119 [Desulfocicer vacuolatum DSM 3385]|uniref:Uncharacterized protein n=1 Tax=Desulfocicer vacuolatum DSM 3385 TaxID=1121400 RepID=A0A1W2A4Q4_9BACT|nr:hypothetical protein SAMN02746065_104119 [Desulfocicer vacuolatum DSM 3385]
MNSAFKTAPRLDLDYLYAHLSSTIYIIIQHSIQFRMVVDMAKKEQSELFPAGISVGYKIRESIFSKN